VVAAFVVFFFVVYSSIRGKLVRMFVPRPMPLRFESYAGLL